LKVAWKVAPAKINFGWELRALAPDLKSLIGNFKSKKKVIEKKTRRYAIEDWIP
jgi:hypothetical protein